MGQAAEDLEKYAETKETAPVNAELVPAEQAEELLHVETDPGTDKQVIKDADGKIVGEKG